VVDAADYSAWKSAFGSSPLAGHSADGNGDGRVDAADYTVWRDNLGAAYIPAGSGAGSVSLSDDSGPLEAALLSTVEAAGSPPTELALAELGSAPATRGANHRGQAFPTHRLSKAWNSDLLLVARNRPIASIVRGAEVTSCNPKDETIRWSAEFLDEAIADFGTQSKFQSVL
jgi:hypothetical protein